MIDAAERALLEQTVHAALADACGGTGGGESVAAVLAQLGWLEMLDDVPGDAIAIVFGALGTHNATAPVLDDVVVSELGMKPQADLAVLLPGFATWQAPGRIEGAHVRGRGLATARASTARDMLVICGTENDLRSVVVPITIAEVRRVHGIDPDAGLHDVHVDGVASSAEPLSATAWQASVALGRRAVAHQIAGACRAMLDLACAHARERVQFGRPIARFQAVRHRLADALVAVEALDATLAVAGAEPSPDTAALAKAAAGRTARSVATHCQQVLAGIGFTTDHAFHRFLKRTMVLEGLFGSTDDIVVHLGRQLVAARKVPTLIEL